MVITFSQKILLVMCFVGDNDSITGVDANVVYVSDMCKNSELRDDQCGGLGLPNINSSVSWIQ